ncbi:right-handed parallel beta-helix repeat-containing protein [Isoptericola halotolerans]|uniref:hypothetical protein n=1 Tax=Isoptericola halotolerans TaxID=300560 RepID=UPI00388CF5B4
MKSFDDDVRPRRQVPRLASGIATALVAGSLIAPASAATPAPDLTLWTSPDGSGDACSEATPCALGTAHEIVAREAASGIDAVVSVGDGVYRLTEPLRFTAADGGQDGGTVSWQAAPDAQPVFSGSTPVTGWSVADADAGVYVADVDGSFRSRQLYVDGEVAQRAKLVVSRDQVELTPDGIRLTAPDLVAELAAVDDEWLDLGGIQNFTHRYSPVESVDGDFVTMSQPAWDNNTYGWDTLQRPFRADELAFENAREFIDEAGEWYLDADAGQLYYKPAAGADITESTVELPRLEELVQVAGTLDEPVTDLSFSGITFTGTSWLGASDGYASQQTGAYIGERQPERDEDITPDDGEIFEAFNDCARGCTQFEASRKGWNMIPSAARVSAASRVTFADNTFVNLGSGGLGIGNDGGATGDDAVLAAQDVTVTRNVFTRSAAGGVLVGGVRPDAHHPSDERMTVKDITVTNNVVTDSAEVFRDHAGIFATYVDGLTIADNEVTEMPYTGIAAGYGWGMWDVGGNPEYHDRGAFRYYDPYDTPTTSQDVVIEENYLYDVMQSMRDGGCIYTLSAMPGSRIDRNYCDTASHAFAIYNDEGSQGITEDRNVFVDVNRYLQVNGQNGNSSCCISMTNTYTDNGNAHFQAHRDQSVTGTVDISGQWPVAATRLAYDAGLEHGLRTAPDARRSALGAFLSASEPSPTAGETFTVAAELANVDQAGVLGITDLSIENTLGWEMTPTREVPASIAANESVELVWEVAVPEGASFVESTTVELEISSRLGDVDFHDVRSMTVSLSAPNVPPITEELATFTNTDATFTQGDGTYSVSGAGTDMFEGFGIVEDQYGAFYQPDSAGRESVSTVRVAEYDDRVRNSKAALVLRNDITRPGASTGYVVLAAQAESGATLFADSDGDGFVDDYQPAGEGKIEPVFLRLARVDSTVTGYVSDDGESWQQVGDPVTLVDGDEMLDVGLTYVSAKPGTVGTASFDNFTIHNADAPVDSVRPVAELVRSTQSAVADGATSGSHTAEVSLPDGQYSMKYNAQDLAGNIARTGRVEFTIDATAPRVTVKDGERFTVGGPDSFEKVSFKLFDAGLVDRVEVNGVVKDLSDNRWSDVNFLVPGTFGAVQGANVLEVFDVAGNSSTVEFTLS